MCYCDWRLSAILINMSTQVTLSQAFNHHHTLNKQRDHVVTAAANTNSHGINNASNIIAVAPQNYMAKNSSTSLRSKASSIMTTDSIDTTQHSLPPNIDKILIQQARDKKNKRYLVKAAKSSLHLNKDLPSLPPSEVLIEFVSILIHVLFSACISLILKATATTEAITWVSWKSESFNLLTFSIHFFSSFFLYSSLGPTQS